MDYKEKYEMALERARDVYTYYCDDREQLRKIESIFPELAESEDEKIRKELLKFLEGIWHLGKNAPFEKWDKSDCSKWIAWLEKQGDQKPILNVPTRDVILSIWDLGNEWKELTNGCISTEYGTQLNYIQKHWHESEYYLKEKQGEQKSIDKVEPKFHVGDWITNGNYTWKIVEVKPLDYILQSQDGNVVDDTISHVDEQFHSFTIEDAKDSDVIACENGRISIFKCLNDNLFSSYCFIDNKGWFCGDEGQMHMLDTIICGEIYPATKEQRDLLFQKMKEAGYQWDSEKKELKKFHIIDEGKAEMDYCFTKMMNGEKVSSTWSKEDEAVWAEISDLLWEGYKQSGSKFSWDDIRNWVNPKLKSLKTRHTWKPSDEQMADLWNMLCECRPADHQLLQDIYYGLKKLREDKL